MSSDGFSVLDEVWDFDGGVTVVLDLVEDFPEVLDQSLRDGRLVVGQVRWQVVDEVVEGFVSFSIFKTREVGLDLIDEDPQVFDLVYLLAADNESDVDEVGESIEGKGELALSSNSQLLVASDFVGLDNNVDVVVSGELDLLGAGLSFKSESYWEDANGAFDFLEFDSRVSFQFQVADGDTSTYKFAVHDFAETVEFNRV